MDWNNSFFTNRRAQVSLFILIGVLIISSLIMLYFLRDRVFNYDEVYVPTEAIPVKKYVDFCIQDSVPPALYLLASNGGHIYGYNYTLLGERKNIAYHMYSGKYVAPSREFMQEELSIFIERAIVLCMLDFNDSQYSDVEYGDINVDTYINKEDVRVDVNFPITIETLNEEIKISDFTSTFPVRLGYIIESKDKILFRLNNDERINLDNLVGYDFEVNVMPYDEDSIIYSIYDEASNIKNNEFVFNFAIRRKDKNKVFIDINDIENQKVKVGHKFYYDVNTLSSGVSNVKFYDETLLFDIDELSGIIDFVPDLEDMGTHEITIIAKNDDFKDVETFLLEVQDE